MEKRSYKSFIIRFLIFVLSIGALALTECYCVISAFEESSTSTRIGTVNWTINTVTLKRLIKVRPNYDVHLNIDATESPDVERKVFVTFEHGAYFVPGSAKLNGWPIDDMGFLSGDDQPIDDMSSLSGGDFPAFKPIELSSEQEMYQLDFKVDIPNETANQPAEIIAYVFLDDKIQMAHCVRINVEKAGLGILCVCIMELVALAGAVIAMSGYIIRTAIQKSNE